MSSEEEYSDDGGDDIYQADSPMAESYDQGDGPSNYAGNSNDVNGNDQAGGEQRQKRKYVRRKDPGERKKRGPRPKDVNAPRIPLNGYVRFLNANRERVKNENPQLSFADVTKKLASQWSSMEYEHKKVFLDEARKEKEEYLIAVRKYRQTDNYHAYVKLKNSAMKQQKQAFSSRFDGGTSSNSSMISGAMTQQQLQQVYELGGGSNHQQYYNDNTYGSGNVYNAQHQQHPSYTGYNNNMSAAVGQQYYQKGGGSAKQSAYGQKGATQRGGDAMNQPGKGGPRVFDGYGPSGAQRRFNYESDSNDAKTPDSNFDDNQGNAEAFEKILANLSTVLDLPIFTEEFLDHNKLRDRDLKRVRTIKQDNEEENAILSKHVESMQQQFEGLRMAEVMNRQANCKLKGILDRLQHNLTECLKDVSIPPDYCDRTVNRATANGGQACLGPPNMQSIDLFMAELDRFRQTTNNNKPTPETNELAHKLGKAFSSITADLILKD